MEISWKKITISEWYGQKQKTLLVCSGEAIWSKPSFASVPLQWVLIKDPEVKLKSTALLCTDINLPIEQVISYFVRRWAVEVTFGATSPIP